MGGDGMKSNEFFSKYLSVGMELHALCDRLGLSRDDAKLLTYIHVKAIEQGRDWAGAEENHDRALEAIDFLLDKQRGVNNASPKDKAVQSLQGIPKALYRTEREARQKFGLEFCVSAELLRRKRFHTDAGYRREMLDLYRDRILPGLA